MTFGRGIENMLIDSPTAVAQAILTRLRSWQGEWYLDLEQGMPYLQRILGHPPSANVPDAAIRATIQNTPYVRQVLDYASNWQSTARSFTVTCRVVTDFGPITQAPSGALIRPDGTLILPLAARPAAFLTEPPPQITGGRPVLTGPQRRLPPPQ